MLIRGNSQSLSSVIAPSAGGASSGVAVAVINQGGGGGGFAPTEWSMIGVTIDGSPDNLSITLFSGEPALDTFIGDIIIASECTLPSGSQVLIPGADMYASCTVTYGTVGDTQTETLEPVVINGSTCFLFAIPSTGGELGYTTEFALVSD